MKSQSGDLLGPFSLERLAALIHPTAVLGWIVAAGLSRSAESILFAVVVACATVRFRTVMDRLRPGRSPLALKLYLLLLLWLAAALIWRPSQLPLGESIPGRWCLMPFLILPLELPSKQVLVAMMIAGLLWAVIALLLALEVYLPDWLNLKHPSKTYLGLVMLFAAGAGLLSESNAKSRALGAAIITTSLLAVSFYASRTLAVSFGITSLALPIACRRGQRATTAAIVAGILIAITLAGLNSPLGRKIAAKFPHSWASSPDGSYRDRLASAYRDSTSSRHELHSWTIQRIPEHWLLGHGAESWSYAWDAEIQSGTASSRWSLIRESAQIGPAGWHAHQLYLQVLYEYGVIGTVLFLCCISTIARSAWKRHDVLGTAALALTCVLLVSGLAEGELPSFSLAVYFALLLTLISLPRAQESPRDPVRDSQPVGPQSPRASESLPQSASNHPTPRFAAATADLWPQAEPRTCNSP